MNASEAILSRIVHINIDRAGQNAKTLAAAVALETTLTSAVSGFVLAATKREASIMETILTRYQAHHDAIRDRGDVKMSRILKCHAQLMAIVDALRLVVKLSDEQYTAAIQLISNMAAERQLVINADHPIVQEFWDAYAYLNGDDEHQPQLNHSCDEDLIAVNLNEFIEVAANHRQQVPALRDLKKVLRTSRQYKFLEVKTVKSRIRQNSSQAGSSKASTVHCWVFKKGA